MCITTHGMMRMCITAMRMCIAGVMSSPAFSTQPDETASPSPEISCNVVVTVFKGYSPVTAPPDYPIVWGAASPECFNLHSFLELDLSAAGDFLSGEARGETFSNMDISLAATIAIISNEAGVSGMDNEKQRRDIGGEFLESDAHWAVGFRGKEELGTPCLQRVGAGGIDVDGRIAELIPDEALCPHGN
ncbi:hypothetical protein SESBI_03834 [Sesbania bispinosa]|nr:hypothetical protein SESBI_03834 [Sesbania bispinosa]